MGTTCGCHPVNSLGGFQFVLSLGVKVLAGMSSVTRNYMGMPLECSENVGWSKPTNVSFNSTGGSIQYQETCNQSLSASYDYIIDIQYEQWYLLPTNQSPLSSAPTLPFLRWAAVVKLRRLVSPGFVHHTTPLHSRPFCQALAPGTQVLIPPVQTSNRNLEKTPVFAGFLVWKTQTFEVCRFKSKNLLKNFLDKKIYSGTIQVKQVNQVNHWIPRFFPEKKCETTLRSCIMGEKYLKMQNILCISKVIWFLWGKINL